jgi:hypothetical protein
MLRVSPLLPLLLPLLLASSASAGVITLLAAQDAAIYEDPTGGLANGAGQHLFVGNTNAGLARRSLLAFDLRGLQSGWTITSVTLTLHYSAGQPGTTDVSLHRALATWSEGASDPEGNEGGGAPAGPSDTTWLHRGAPDLLWSNLGGDFLEAASATTAVGGAFGFRSWSGAGLVADVQAWLDGGAVNAGWFLRGLESGAGTAKRFDSRQHPDAQLVPRLEITYVVPTPAAWILLAGAALGRGAVRSEGRPCGRRLCRAPSLPCEALR